MVLSIVIECEEIEAEQLTVIDVRARIYLAPPNQELGPVQIRYNDNFRMMQIDRPAVQEVNQPQDNGNDSGVDDQNVPHNAGDIFDQDGMNDERNDDNAAQFEDLNDRVNFFYVFNTCYLTLLDDLHRGCSTFARTLGGPLHRNPLD